MKTTEQFLKDHTNAFAPFGQYSEVNAHQAMDAMREHTEQAIKEVLSRAANTAPLGVLSSDKKREARSSILSTPYQDLLK